jgi:hypothetical protein
MPLPPPPDERRADKVSFGWSNQVQPESNQVQASPTFFQKKKDCLFLLETAAEEQGKAAQTSQRECRGFRNGTDAEGSFTRLTEGVDC